MVLAWTLVTVFAVVAGGVSAIELTYRSLVKSRKEEAASLAATVADSLRQQFESAFAPLYVLAEAVRERDPLTYDALAINASFDALATRTLAAVAPGGLLQSLGLAPQGVMINIYPRTQAELETIVIGHPDLLSDPDRRAFIVEGIETGSVVIQGPMVPIQGGILAFAR